MSVKNEHSLNIDSEIKKKKMFDTKLNVPIKNEHPLNIDPEIKKITKIDNGFDKTQINKAGVKCEGNRAKIPNKKADVKSDDNCIKNKKNEVKDIIDSKMDLPVKSENLLIIDPEIKKITEIKDDGCTETQDKKDDLQSIDDTELEPVVEERRIFRCQNCNMTERYDYFSDHTPFNRSVRTKVAYYLTKDPFSPRTERQVLILGSVCSLCDRDVCIKPECSIFYSKFYCSTCARQNIKDFPFNIQNKIKAAKRI